MSPDPTFESKLKQSTNTHETTRNRHEEISCVLVRVISCVFVDHVFFRPYLIRFLRLLLFQFEPMLLALLFDLFGRALLRAPLLRPEPSRQRDEDRHGPDDRAPRRED